MRVGLFATGLAVTLAFMPGWLDSGTAPRWALLAIAVPLILLCLRPREYLRPSVTLTLILLSLFVNALATRYYFGSYTGIDDLIHLAILLLTFYLGFQRLDLSPAWMGIAVGVNINAAIAIAQSLGWDGIVQTAAPGGLFVNRNVLAEAGAVGLVAALSLRKWWLVPGAFISAVIPFSKNVIAALVLAVLLRRDARVWRVAMVGAVLFLLLVAIGHPSVDVRIAIWADAIRQLSFFGHGVGSFARDFPEAYYAHNDYLQIFYELGCLPAMVIMAGLIQALRSERGTEHWILFTISCIAVFSFPYEMPVTAFAAALAAGDLLSRRVPLRYGQPKGRMVNG